MRKTSKKVTADYRRANSKGGVGDTAINGYFEIGGVLNVESSAFVID